MLLRGAGGCGTRGSEAASELDAILHSEQFKDSKLMAILLLGSSSCSVPGRCHCLRCRAFRRSRTARGTALPFRMQLLPNRVSIE